MGGRDRAAPRALWCAHGGRPFEAAARRARPSYRCCRGSRAGSRPGPRTLVAPDAQRFASVYARRIILDFEVETVAVLTGALLRSLSDLASFLRDRDLTTAALRIELVHRTQKSTPLRIGLACPSADLSHLSALVSQSLERLTLAAPVVELIVRAEPLLPAESASRDLLAEDAHTHLSLKERKARLIEHFETRLGARAIGALQAAGDYRPECAQRWHRINLDSGLPQTPPVDALPQRPLWLLREPRAMNVANHKELPFSLVRGPESIEFGWWDRHPVERDYFVARSRQGALWWVFREPQQPDSWYLHGLFG
jgi:protein ImuB